MHSKIVRRGIALSYLVSVLKKARLHNINDSFKDQMERHHSSGFPWQVLSEVLLSLGKKVKRRIT